MAITPFNFVFILVWESPFSGDTSCIPCITVDSNHAQFYLWWKKYGKISESVILFSPWLKIIFQATTVRVKQPPIVVLQQSYSENFGSNSQKKKKRAGVGESFFNKFKSRKLYCNGTPPRVLPCEFSTPANSLVVRVKSK